MRQYIRDSFSRDQVIISIFAVVILSIFCFIANIPMAAPLILYLLGVYLFYFRKAKFRTLLHLGFLLALIVFAAHSILEYSLLSTFYIPIASVAMLTMLLFSDLQLAFLMSLAASAVVTLVVAGDFNYFLTFFMGSVAGVFTVRNARTRGKLISGGIVVGMIQSAASLLLNPAFNRDILLYGFKPLFLNGLICCSIVFAAMKVFEWLFGEITNFTLLELADSSNQPLLKRMVLEAPGTYHHSLIVSNLSEAAADAVGAHGLLARVGAYYHDIGKLEKPEYFTENQMIAGNKHDSLEPTMSKLVILNHVKEGIELAKKHRLNHKIIDFIPEHHGTGIIYYFYQRALEAGEEVKDEDFRYPGPKPQTRETAIVLLADSVEGATRSLDDHNPVKIGEVVRKIVNNKFIDGQLDECDLTLKDIEVICNTFTRVLSAMYHGRVRYPEKKSNGNHGNKSSKEDSDQNSDDKKNHQQNS